MAQSNLADQSTGSEVVDKQKAAALAVATFSFVTGQRAKAENLAMLAAYFEAARMLQIAGLTQAGLHAIAQEGLRSARALMALPKSLDNPFAEEAGEGETAIDEAYEALEELPDPEETVSKEEQGVEDDTNPEEGEASPDDNTPLEEAESPESEPEESRPIQEEPASAMPAEEPKVAPAGEAEPGTKEPSKEPSEQKKDEPASDLETPEADSEEAGKNPNEAEKQDETQAKGGKETGPAGQEENQEESADQKTRVQQFQENAAKKLSQSVEGVVEEKIGSEAVWITVETGLGSAIPTLGLSLIPMTLVLDGFLIASLAFGYKLTGLQVLLIVLVNILTFIYLMVLAGIVYVLLCNIPGLGLGDVCQPVKFIGI